MIRLLVDPTVATLGPPRSRYGQLVLLPGDVPPRYRGVCSFMVTVPVVLMVYTQCTCKITYLLKFTVTTAHALPGHPSMWAERGDIGCEPLPLLPTVSAHSHSAIFQSPSWKTVPCFRDVCALVGDVTHMECWISAAAEL